jgi:hypothetical protein
LKPKLIHKVKVIYQNIDSVNTTYDDRWGEPTGDVTYKSAVTINGQVKIFKERTMIYGVGTVEFEADGYVLVEKADSENILEKAKITSIAGENVEYYVNDKTIGTFYDNQGYFRKVYFKTKKTA